MDRRQLLGAFCATAAASLITPEVARAAAPAWAPAFADLDADVPRTAMKRVHGRAPDGLAGALYRNGPGKFRRPGGSVEHWFDGDGLMRAFRVAGGEATIEARFIDTPKRRTDTAANAVVTPGFGTPARPGAKVGNNDDVNAANISVMRVGSELWALWEGGSPIAVDPADLSTLGVRTLRPDLKHMPFLAHPVRGPDEVWSLGVSGKKAIVWHLATDGTLKGAHMLDLPRASYIHDFVATPRHLVLYLQPWVQDRFSTPFADSFSWRPDEGTQVLVLDKADLSKRRVYELPAAFAFHFGGAWEDADGTIRFDGCFSPDPMFARENGKALMTGTYRRQDPPLLGLITLRPDGKASFERLGVTAEFPRTGARPTDGPRRYTIHATGYAPDLPMFNGLATHDWKTGRTDAFDFGAGLLMEEAVFVARPGGSDELDGWLLAPAVNLKAGVTELHVLNAARVADGPICTWRAPMSLPVSLHGTFVRA